MKIDVDPEANFLEFDKEENCRVIEELVTDLMYDVDDVKLIECEVTNG